MRKNQKSFFERISLGYSFGEDREALSLVFINYFTIIIFGLVVLLLHCVENDLVPATYRYHSIVVLSLLNIWLLQRRQINIARVLILVSLPFLLLILPPLSGILSDEFYFWFPYVPIGFSIIPHFILNPIRHRTPLLITLAIYLSLSLFIDDYLIFFSDGSEKIIPLVIENRFYYKMIPLLLFLFINGVLHLLFVKNHQFKEIMDIQREDLILSEKMASLGTLTSGLAHEINNPLNFISGSLNALNTLRKNYRQSEAKPRPEETKANKQMDQVIASAFEGVDRATEIISKLESFANPEGNQDRRKIKLDVLINDTLRSLESRLPYYINLIVEIPGDLKVQCNEQQLRLVFSHIIRNAIDALESMEKQGRETIRISVSRESLKRKPYICISIYNSGPVIPEEHIKQIFDPFFSSRDTGEGLGLGMSLSYMIIKEHGGKLEIKNKTPGVCFDVYLPAWVL